MKMEISGFYVEITTTKAIDLYVLGQLKERIKGSYVCKTSVSPPDGNIVLRCTVEDLIEAITAK